MSESPESRAARIAKLPIVDLSPDEDAPDMLATGPILAYRGVEPGKQLPALLRNELTYKALIWMALPSFLEQVINSIVAFTDTFVAGHGSTQANNASASAAVGAMTYLQWFCGLMGSSVGVGATAIVSRSIGAGRMRIAQRVAGTAICSAAVLGVFLGACLFIFASQIVTAFGLAGQAHDDGVSYLRIMCFTICLQAVGQIGQACLRGSGDLVKPMIVAATIMCVNLIAVPALAYGWFGIPAMGIKGNAMGTLLAFIISGGLTLIFLTSGKAKLTLRMRHFKIIPHILARVMKISLPSWAEGVLLWGGQFLIIFFVTKSNDLALAEKFGGSADSGLTMSTHSTVLRIEMFAFLPGFGIGMATAAIVGQALGARRPDIARKASLMSLRLAVIAMTLLALPMILFPTRMTLLMVDNNTAGHIGFWPMILAGLAQPGFAIAIIMASTLKGAGDTLSAMISTIVGMFIVRIPVIFAAIFLFNHYGHPALGLTAIWIAIFIDLNFRAIYNYTIFLRGKWQHRKV